MKAILMAILLPLALAGCAQLAVDVSILDRKYWSSPEQLGNEISEQVAIVVRKRGDGTFDATREAMKSQVHMTLVELAKPNCAVDPISKKSSACVDPAQVETLNAGAASFVDKAFNDADASFQNAFLGLSRASAAQSSDSRTTALFEAQRQLEAGNAFIRRAQSQLSADLRSKINSLPSLSNPAVATSKTVAVVKKADGQLQDLANSLTGGRGILDDPLASSVVYAPESYWRRTEPPPGINNTFASGSFGNTDIAIKMESVGSFTIKGVRLDASKITQATFAVGRQAIKTVAAIYGLPAGLADASTPVAAPAGQFSETSIGFSSPDRRRASAEESILRGRLARVSIMETIVIQRAALISPATDAPTESARAVAIKTVKDTFAANRSDLDTTAPTK